MASKMTTTMVGVLRLVHQGRDPFSYCNGMAERGARTSTILALRRRGYLDGKNALTEAGQLAFKAAQASGL